MELKYLGMNTLNFIPEKCTGCGMCVIVCPHRIWKMRQNKAEAARADKCIECGACMRNCAFDAIKVDAGPGCAAAVLVSKFTKNKQVCC